MNYGFPDYSKVFSNPSFGISNTIKPFEGGPTSLLKGSGGSSGGSGMDPLSLGLGLGSSVIGGLFGMGQAATSANIAQAQLAAQNQAILEGRSQTKAALGQSMWGPLFQAGAGGDIAFGREKEAEKFRRQFLAPMDIALSSEASRRERLARISPESKEAARFENQMAIQRALAERRAQTDAMFGPISSSYYG